MNTHTQLQTPTPFIYSPLFLLPILSFSDQVLSPRAGSSWRTDSQREAVWQQDWGGKCWAAHWLLVTPPKHTRTHTHTHIGRTDNVSIYPHQNTYYVIYVNICTFWMLLGGEIRGQREGLTATWIIFMKTLKGVAHNSKPIHFSSNSENVSSQSVFCSVCALKKQSGVHIL